MTRTRMGLVPGLLLALALALAIGACGGDGGNSNDGVASLDGGKATTTTTRAGAGNDRQKALAYARCMRQHGIDAPDPTFDAAGHMGMQMPSGVGPDDPKFKAAEQACKQYAPSAEPEKVDPQVQQQMLAFARCMRQHGINIADPKPGEGIDADGAAGVNPNSPEFKAADQVCQQYVPPKRGEKQEQSNSAGGGG